MSVSVMINEAATALDEYETPHLQVVRKHIYCWRQRRWVSVLSADMGQKTRVTPSSGWEQLTPDFSRKMQIKGLRRQVGELLRSEGPLPIDEISHRIDAKTSTIVSQLTRQPEFYTTGGSFNAVWHLDETWLNQAIASGQAEITISMRERIAEHIRVHGPSSINEIKETVGGDPAVTLHKYFTVVEPEILTTWGLTEEGHTAKFKYKSMAARVVETLRIYGPLTTTEIAEKLEVKGRAVNNGIRDGKDCFYKVKPRQAARWGFK